MSGPNVLRLDDADSQSPAPNVGLFGRIANRDYRAAVSCTIRSIKADHNLSNERLAERLGCSEGTVFNAENENGNLDPVTMLNIAAMFGGQCAIRPILALINGGSPRPPETTVEKRRRLIRELSALDDDA